MGKPTTDEQWIPKRSPTGFEDTVTEDLFEVVGQEVFAGVKGGPWNVVTLNFAEWGEGSQLRANVVSKDNAASIREYDSGRVGEAFSELCFRMAEDGHPWNVTTYRLTSSGEMTIQFALHEDPWELDLAKNYLGDDETNSASTSPAAPTELPSNLPPLPTDFAKLVEFAGNHIAAQQQAHAATWGLGTDERFDVDLSAGTITWQFPDKQVTAAAELLGTWNPTDQTFLWAWDHPSAPPGTAIASNKVKTWAEENGVIELQSATITCDMDTCYNIAGIASPIGELQGVYRFDAGGPWAYVGFGNVTLKSI